ncbi:MAG: glycerophosphodiester phosphodiesterase [Mesorhizobium amorphae]|nr:MAG: glycerophosphodiester phosphodiesterase [Mesorhizobium amorphae]
MLRFAGWAAALAAVLFATPLFSQSGTHADLILARFENARAWRHHILVAAHRGSAMEEGRFVRPENSRASIEHAIEIGAEIVEIDVSRAADGALVVMHDTWLDRTTTCRGRLADHTLAELRACRLKVQGGVATEEPVPTLAELLAVARGRILVNVDNKIGPEAIPAIAAEAEALGMGRHVILKENIWSPDRMDAVAAWVDRAPGIRFMPILADDAVREAGFATRVAERFAAVAVEAIAWRKDAEPMTHDGGPLFAPAMRAAADKGGWHLWADTFSIVNKPGGMLSGGRGDKLAVLADLPEEGWGFWIDRGATVLHTDEPGAMIRWLDAQGLRAPYALTN